MLNDIRKKHHLTIENSTNSEHNFDVFKNKFIENCYFIFVYKYDLNKLVGSRLSYMLRIFDDLSKLT